MPRKKKIIVAPGSEITLRQTKSEKILKIIAPILQTGVFITLTVSIIITKMHTDTIIEQYENSIKPQLYGTFVTKSYYEEYIKNKGFRSAKEKELLKGITIKETGAWFFFAVENPTPNIAFKVSAFIGLSNESIELIKRGKTLSEETEKNLAMIKSGRLLGGGKGAKYIKPDEHYVIPLNIIVDEDMSLYVNEIYEEEDTEEIITSSLLSNPEGETFFAIVYQDIRGEIYINKTKWVYDEEGRTIFKKTKIYELSKM